MEKEISEYLRSLQRKRNEAQKKMDNISREYHETQGAINILTELIGKEESRPNN